MVPFIVCAVTILQTDLAFLKFCDARLSDDPLEAS